MFSNFLERFDNLRNNNKNNKNDNFQEQPKYHLGDGKKIPLYISFDNSYVDGGENAFCLVSEEFWNYENCINDESTMDSIFSDYHEEFRLIPESEVDAYEKDLYLDFQNTNSIISFKGHTYAFDFESCESTHRCTLDGNDSNQISQWDIIDALNNSWKYFEIVKIV